MTCPGTYPTVLNGQIYYNDSSTVEYECLSGFYMTGNKRITCTTGTWQTAPTCSVIRQYDDVDVYPDWWLIALAVLLGLIVLACFLCLILYFCCCRGDNTVHPYRGYNSGVCCGGGCGCGRCCECCEPRRTRPMDVDEDGGGVYYVPVNSTPIQAGYLVRKKTTTETKATNTDDTKKTGSKNTVYSTAHNTQPRFDTRSSYVHGGTTIMPNGTSRTYDSNAWSEDRTARDSDTKTWKDRSNYEAGRPVRNKPITKTRAIDTDSATDYTKKAEPKNTAYSTNDDNDQPRSNTRSSYVYGGRTTMPHNGAAHTHDSNAWNVDRTARTSDTKTWKDGFNYETRSDGDLNEQPFKPKKPASKPPGWMPHSHPMRNINTSTK